MKGKKVEVEEQKEKWIFQILPLDINHQISLEAWESALLWTEVKTWCEWGPEMLT